MPLMTARCRQAFSVPSRPAFRQCITMPVCDRVNAVNTPRTYSWISRSRFASNSTIRAEDSTVAEMVTAGRIVGMKPRSGSVLECSTSVA